MSRYSGPGSLISRTPFLGDFCASQRWRFVWLATFPAMFTKSMSDHDYTTKWRTKLASAPLPTDSHAATNWFDPPGNPCWERTTIATVQMDSQVQIKYWRMEHWFTHGMILSRRNASNLVVPWGLLNLSVGSCCSTSKPRACDCFRRRPSTRQVARWFSPDRSHLVSETACQWFYMFTTLVAPPVENSFSRTQECSYYWQLSEGERPVYGFYI
jgi:hypothetical protein